MLRVPILLLLSGVWCVASAQEYSLQAQEVLLSELMQVEAVTEQPSGKSQAVGQVRDVLFDRDGDMISLLVDHAYVGNSVAEPVHADLYEFDVANMHYDATNARMLLAEEESRRHAVQHVKLLPSGQVRASELLELQVDLVEARAAGVVQDVLMDLEKNRAAGIVVEVGPMLSKTRYLFPADMNAYDRSSQTLKFAIRETELETLPRLPNSR